MATNRQLPKLPEALSTPPPAAPYRLSDEEWFACRRVIPIPGPRECGRPRTNTLREIVDAIHYRWCTGCPPRKLPPELPPCNTVEVYHRRWAVEGVLTKLRAILKPPKSSTLPSWRRKNATNPDEG